MSCAAHSLAKYRRLLYLKEEVESNRSLTVVAQSELIATGPSQTKATGVCRTSYAHFGK